MKRGRRSLRLWHRSVLKIHAKEKICEYINGGRNLLGLWHRNFLETHAKETVREYINEMGKDGGEEDASAEMRIQKLEYIKWCKYKAFWNIILWSSLLYRACCFNLFFIVPTHALHYTLTLKSHTKTLKIRPYMFRSPLKPSSCGPWPYFLRFFYEFLWICRIMNNGEISISGIKM